MVTYDTNCMGVANMSWYRKRGLTKEVQKVVRSECVAKIYDIDIGDTYTVEEVTQEYACGRIDIRDSSKEGYDAWDEYSLSPMPSEDWRALSSYLNDLTTERVLRYDELIYLFEEWYGKKIRWYK